MLTKRNILIGSIAAPALAVLSACTGSGGKAVPTIGQIQAWTGVLQTELPVFVDESITTGLIKDTAIAKAKAALSTFNLLAQQVLAPTFNLSTASSILGQIGMALTTVLSVIPATAPFVPLVQTFVVLITAFLAATPVVVPPTPTPATLAGLHKATVHFKG